MEIREKLATCDPDNTEWQRDLSNIYQRFGDVQVGQGDPSTASISYQKSLEIREKLAAQDPTNPLWQSDLSVSYEKIGDVQKRQGDPLAALSSYQKSLAIRELIVLDPDDTLRERDLSGHLREDR
jgi:tetratricopeptide (TPR) repeat protein